jgi:hypothetical protein
MHALFNLSLLTSCAIYKVDTKTELTSLDLIYQQEKGQKEKKLYIQDFNIPINSILKLFKYPHKTINEKLIIF